MKKLTKRGGGKIVKKEQLMKKIIQRGNKTACEEQTAG